MLLQYIRIICLSISCRRSKYTSNYFPSCSILPYWKVQFRNHGYGHTSVTPLYCSNQSLRVAFPECPCNRRAIHLLIKFFCETQKFVSLLSITVEVLFCIRDLKLAFRRVKFFLQVFTTDFNSFRRGKYKVIRSLVSVESYENYSFRCSGQLASLPFFCYWRVSIKTVNHDVKIPYLNYFPLILTFMLIIGTVFW